VAVVAKVNEKALTRMEVRKLNALRRSIGDELGEKAFLEWLTRKTDRTIGSTRDRNAASIASTVEGLIARGDVKTIRRGGYMVKRGRGRVIVEPRAD